MTRIYLLGAVGLIAIAIIAGAFLYGRRTMNAEWEAKTLQQSVEALRDRRDTNENIRGLSDSDLCRALGGRVPDDDPKQCL